MTKLSNWQSFVFRITKPRQQGILIQQQDYVSLNWRDTVLPLATRLVMWPMAAHWMQAVLPLATMLMVWPMAAQLSNESCDVIGYKACGVTNGSTTFKWKLCCHWLQVLWWPHTTSSNRDAQITETLAWCLTHCSNESIQYLISFSRDCKGLRELELKNWHKLGFFRVTRRANANNWCGLMRPHFFAYEFLNSTKAVLHSALLNDCAIYSNMDLEEVSVKEDLNHWWSLWLSDSLEPTTNGTILWLLHIVLTHWGSVMQICVSRVNHHWFR